MKNENSVNLDGFDEPRMLSLPQKPPSERLKSHYRTLFPDYNWKAHKGYLELMTEFLWIYDDIQQGTEKRWLTVCGQSGTGKTAWAKKLNQQLKKNDRKTQMWNWNKICKMLGEREYGILEHLESVPILFIDEIGLNDWKVGNEKLSILMDRRLTKWTINMTNMRHGEVAEKVDTRIASRMNRNHNRVYELPSDCPDFHHHLKTKKMT